MKKVQFKITYKGDNPPTKDQVMGALLDNAMDEEGIIEVTEIKPKTKKNGKRKARK